jgi:hypothetical protein
MLVALQRLVPAGAAAAGAGSAGGDGRRSPQDAQQLAVGVSGMCEVLLDNITRCAASSSSSSGSSSNTSHVHGTMFVTILLTGQFELLPATDSSIPVAAATAVTLN